MSPSVAIPGPNGPVLTPSEGPDAPMASQARCGLRLGAVQHYRQQAGGGASHLADGFDVAPEQVWELAVFPSLGSDSTTDDGPDPDWDGCHLGLALRLGDDLVVPADQHGHPIDGTRQCLVAENWNLLQADLSDLVGRRVDEVLLTSHIGRTGQGWLQALGVAEAPVEADDVVDRVRTTRGSHSAFLYSRGNTLPTANLPHGAHQITPLTESRDRNWLYGWHRDGGPRPRLQALAFCHAPSPWIGDNGAFQLMAWQGRPTVTPHVRARAFDHADELDRPHHYRVRLEGGITAEATPTMHAGVFRFTFDQGGDHGIILDMPYLGNIDAWQLPDGRIAFSGVTIDLLSWVANERTKPAGYVYGETSEPATLRRAWERRSPLDGFGWRGKRFGNSWLGRTVRIPMRRRQAAVLQTDAASIEVKVAMSRISTTRAKLLLADQVGRAGFDEVCERAHAVWAEVLGRLEIDGGRLDDRVNAWSNLARLLTWPSVHHEPGPDGRPVYASPFGEHERLVHGRDRTGCRVVDGELVVNNGYWDTFRTAWPLYSLLTPSEAPRLLSGILQQYRDGGWMARWSAPGYVDCMPGTSSDAIFADASVQGTFGDGPEALALELEAYDSALRNALGPSESSLTGRKGIGRGRFVGWIDTSTEEGLSWTMDNCNNDAAIALWSSRLAARAALAGGDGAGGEGTCRDALAPAASLAARRSEFEANAVWFANRSLAHGVVFDERVGFYLGRRPDGSWRVEPEDFDPTHWGHDYTETSAWGQAFHAPHDGAGLADLLGGEDALAAKLDQLLATPAPTRPSMFGSYTYNTQEMNEAQAAGMGQLAISNQPAHHIPFMYLFAGRPWQTQWLTRELLDKQFVGSEIGQGYPGDEDNGEMSGYWLCLAMGLFPLFVGGGEWAVTAPLFERMAFTRDDGTRLEVRASGVEHRYIQSLKVNGEPWERVTIPLSVLGGDVLVEFELGPEPSRWGANSRPLSLSRWGQPDGQVARWRSDLADRATFDGPVELLDDEGRHPVQLAAGRELTLTWGEPVEPTFLTLTSPDAEAPAVRIETCGVDGRWLPTGITPRATAHPDQTQAHLLACGPITGLRLVATAGTRLSQLEVR